MKGQLRSTGRNQRLSSPRQRKQQHLLDVKVRSRKAASQRNRKVLAWLCATVLVVGSMGSIWYGSREALRRYFWQNPDYNLAEVNIHTDGPLTREQVLAATGIKEGRNIFALDLSAARKGLMGLAQVEHAEIERNLPNKVTIEITERKPVAWMAAKFDEDPTADPNSMLIDHNGILMRTQTPLADYLHLPVIYGLAIDNYEAGETLDLPEVRAALELIRLCGENPGRDQVRSIDISKGYCLVVTDEHHARVTFPLENLDLQLDRLAMLFNTVESSNHEIQTVNLLVQRNVPVTFVPPPEAEPAAGETAPPPAAPSPSPVPKVAVKKAEAVSPGKKITARRAEPVHRLETTGSHLYHSHPARRETPLEHFSNSP